MLKAAIRHWQNIIEKRKTMKNKFRLLSSCQGVLSFRKRGHISYLEKVNFANSSRAII